MGDNMSNSDDHAAVKSKDVQDAETEKLRYSIQSVHSLASIVTKGESLMGAASYLGELRGALRPRDAIEEMLVDQIAITHARVVKLSFQSLVQRNETWYRTISEACDRAASTFRRLVVTFRDYREPRRTTVMAIQQANLANQQVVQQISGKESSDVSETLPPVTKRPAITSGNDSMQSAVAAFDGSENRPGQESIESELVETRRAVRAGAAGRTRRQ
jgi:hypothetical protein